MSAEGGEVRAKFSGCTWTGGGSLSNLTPKLYKRNFVLGKETRVEGKSPRYKEGFVPVGGGDSTRITGHSKASLLKYDMRHREWKEIHLRYMQAIY